MDKGGYDGQARADPAAALEETRRACGRVALAVWGPPERNPESPGLLGDSSRSLAAADQALPPILIATAVLIALGILGTFPTVFQAFASE